MSPSKSKCSPGYLKQEKAGFVGRKGKLNRGVRVDNAASSEGNGAGQETSAFGKPLGVREWELQRKQHRNLSSSESPTLWAEHHWPSPERDFHWLHFFFQQLKWMTLCGYQLSPKSQYQLLLHLSLIVSIWPCLLSSVGKNNSEWILQSAIFRHHKTPDCCHDG